MVMEAVTHEKERSFNASLVMVFYLLGDEKIMIFSYIAGQAKGAIPNGTKVKKVKGENGDAHSLNAQGVVCSSVGPILFNGKETIGYFVAFDDEPTIPVFILDWKIEKA